MSALWTNGDYTTPLIDGPRRWLAPFKDDNSKYVFEQDYQQLESSFVPLALDTPDDVTVDAYLVEEGQLKALGGGLVGWTRTYSRIPDMRTVPESYSWLVPGIVTGAVYAAVGITGVSNSGGRTTLSSGTSTTASVGDSLSISYTFTDFLTGTSYGRTVLRVMLAGSGTVPTVSLISEPGGTITYQTMKKVEPGRDPEALEVASALQVDYFLPGVSAGVSTFYTIPRIRALEIYDNTGMKSQSFSATTSPTITAWRALTGTPVCVVSSVIRRWMGNIYERSTRYCLAQ